jgi:hypothetical protein
MKKAIQLSGTLFFLVFLTSCLDGPKSREPYTITRTIDKAILDPDVSRAMHKVVISEVIPGSKYVYVLVEENGRQFWISTAKKELNTGETYYYTESILKTAFESKEHNRIFDTLYLVTELVSASHGEQMHGFSTEGADKEQLEIVRQSIASEQDSTSEFAGRIRISDLVDDPEKYEGKKVELKGLCSKVNPGIMGRNWLHLQDGSKDSYDLVITTDEIVEKGSQITIRGVVKLHVDLGSGYVYPILVENGALVR